MWVVLQPLIQAVIFAVILSSVLAAKLPGINDEYAYAIYLLAGMSFWALFSEIITRSTQVFIDNASYLKKISFPSLALPLISVGVALSNFVLFTFAVLAVVVCIGRPLGWALLQLIPLTFITCLLGFGIGLLLGTLNVFVRDIGQVVTVVMQLLFWMTPIVYPAAIIPATLKPWVTLNPLYGLVEAYQNIYIHNGLPDWGRLAWVVLIAGLLTAFALFVYSRASHEMADVL
jgi:lipopolysaccharide transport system permease protein